MKTSIHYSEEICKRLEAKKLTQTIMQKWLIAIPDTTLANWNAADLCEDGKLNVLDLCLMKQLLIDNGFYVK